MKQFPRLLTFLLLLGLLTLPVFGENLVIERQVYEYLTEQLGLPGSSACGILANMEQESAFNPNALGDNGTSYGLCQWHAGRYAALRSFCQGRGVDYQTVAGQLAYLRYELENTYSELLAQLRVQADTADGAFRAAYLWCTEFERPENADQNGILRGTLARGKYWNRYSSIIDLEPEEEPMTQEEVIQIITQPEVTIPQPPEGTHVERYQDTGTDTLTLPTRPYTPRHRPKKADTAAASPAGAFAAAMLFLPLSDGKKEPFRPEFGVFPEMPV